MKFTKEEQIEILSTTIKNEFSIESIKLVAQLIGCPACDNCGFVKSHCRCIKK
jgi:hypothetical protein